MIKKGDSVIFISGKDKGKKGKVLQVMPRADRLVVEGLNLMVKNVRPRKQGEKGQIVRYNAPVHMSNVLLFCSKCGKGRRMRSLIQRDGKRIRICATCKQSFS
ncbi:MAG: 50S ribosomal protein L24 [Patescibacteria group bacterium]|jgi:large subunit ribosomal protein L24